MDRALVAEDAEPVRRLLKIVLERRGMQVHTAKNGREAIEQLQQYHFDLILLDLMMPEVSGSDVIEYLRVHHPELLSRLIVVTAVSERELDRVFGREHDIRIVRKPFDIAQIMEAVACQLTISGPHSTVTCLSCGLQGSFHAGTEKEAWVVARGAGWHVVTFVKEDTLTRRLKTLAITFCPKCAMPGP